MWHYTPRQTYPAIHNRTKNIQALRLAMTLAQEAEIRYKKYDGLDDDDPSVMQISSVPHSEVLAFQRQSGHPRNMQIWMWFKMWLYPDLTWKQILLGIHMEKRDI